MQIQVPAALTSQASIESRYSNALRAPEGRISNIHWPTPFQYFDYLDCELTYTRHSTQELLSRPQRLVNASLAGQWHAEIELLGLYTCWRLQLTTVALCRIEEARK